MQLLSYLLNIYFLAINYCILILAQYTANFYGDPIIEWIKMAIAIIIALIGLVKYVKKLLDLLKVRKAKKRKAKPSV